MMLDDIVKEEIGKQCIKKNNIRCKKSMRRTRVEKMCNVASIVNLLKQIEKQTTLKDIPFYFYLFWLMIFFLNWKKWTSYISMQKSKDIEAFSCSFPIYVVKEMYLWYNHTNIHWCWYVICKTQFLAWFLWNFKNKEKKYHEIWNANYWEKFFPIFQNHVGNRSHTW